MKKEMRKILRNIARVNMRKAGIRHPNKKRLAVNPQTGLLIKSPSYFAEHWREYV